jgi:hypothetical protein
VRTREPQEVAEGRLDKTNGETVAVSQSAVGVLVDAADKTDCREMKSNCGRSRRRSTNG